MDERQAKDTDKCQVGFAPKEGGVIKGGGFTVGDSTAVRRMKVTYLSVPPIEKGMTSAERKLRRKIRNRLSAQQHRERHREYINTLNQKIAKKDLEIHELTQKITSVTTVYEETLQDIEQKYALAWKEIEVMKNYINFLQSQAANGGGNCDLVLCPHLSKEFPSYHNEFTNNMMVLGGELVSPPTTIVLDYAAAAAPVDSNIRSDCTCTDDTVSEVYCHHNQTSHLVDDLDLGNLFHCDSIVPLPYCQHFDDMEDVKPDVEAATPPVEYSGHCNLMESSDTASSSSTTTSPSMERQSGRLRSTMPLLMGAATLGLLCFSGVLMNVCLGKGKDIFTSFRFKY